MENYTYKNTLICKKELKKLLAWSFTKYDCMQACLLADELKYLGFKYATIAGISISIEDLKVPFIKDSMLQTANQNILNAEKICSKGHINDVERFQKMIDTWSLISESLKNEVINYFKNYDPLNSVYIMTLSGARGNLSQVRQLVGMRGLMSDPSGEIMKLPIKRNFREGLTITDYLMSGYGARKGIIDTALKTANAGYLTRRLIDVAQDIIIREKDCLTNHSFIIANNNDDSQHSFSSNLIGQLLNKPIYDPETNILIAEINTQITFNLLQTFIKRKISYLYIRSPLTCNLYRSICQKCYGWNLATENLIDIGEAIGIIAGQSIGEPGTQLTMRTFHTGGIFTSEINQQIMSPVDGIIKFSKELKTVTLRTNCGDDVVITKNSGPLLLIPNHKKEKILKIEVLRNTILFSKNNQYLKKNTVIGELTQTDKQVRTEIKPVLSTLSGEVFVPRLKSRGNSMSCNKLLWIFSGHVYKAPKNSFLNFYSDHKLNKNSYIYRTKLINHYPGYIDQVTNETNLFQRTVKVTNNSSFLSNSNIRKLTSPLKNKHYILNFNTQIYTTNFICQNNKFFVTFKENSNFITSHSNKFLTLTGGVGYYNYQVNSALSYVSPIISYYSSIKQKAKKVGSSSKKSNRIYTLIKRKYISHRTLIWLSEETYNLDCDKNILLTEHGHFISKNFEIIAGIFSKTAGIVSVSYKNKMVEKVSIKSGFVYKVEKFPKYTKQVVYPGEVLFDHITISQPSLCEYIITNNSKLLLIRPLQIYEFPVAKSLKNNIIKNSTFTSKLISSYSYKSNQQVKTSKSLNIIFNVSHLILSKKEKSETTIELLNNQLKNRLDISINEKINLNNYITTSLKYTNIESCFLARPQQFVDSYTTLGYLEAVTPNTIEIVKLKSKKNFNKEILLISNEHCTTIKKEMLKPKIINNLIINTSNINETGRILIDNDQFITIQRGRPYFFPNCRNENVAITNDLNYKIVSLQNVPFANNLQTNRLVNLNYYDLTKYNAKIHSSKINNEIYHFKSKVSKIFLRKNGKFYSSTIPRLFNQFSITDKVSKKLFDFHCIKKHLHTNKDWGKKLKKEKKTLLLQNSELALNPYKQGNKLDYKLTLVQFAEYPFAKSISLHAITEDYLEQEMNTVYLKNDEFINEGETVGLVNLEKEITGDIVQGLPRVEELLEARKKRLKRKRIPTNQKKNLLVQKSSIDPNFEFRKLGTTVKESERVNPHKLLKIYFNYYGSVKSFFCDKKETVYDYYLIDDIYEASYKSFKKVQSLILDSVQSVYCAQGVSIADKHLEIVIKQMTTKIIVTYGGNTPLLPCEVVDLYHIKYINEIIKFHEKETAYYVPFLLGITKSALNNPSFLSAASFQETTRVLTKAAIEGRIDWLRGLKENIIIGHLIPAGTGIRAYKDCFKQTLLNNKKFMTHVSDLKKFNLRI